HLPVTTNTKNGYVAFILNHLRLGEVATDSIHSLKSNISVHWRTASEAELQQFEERGVWEAVSPTANMEVLGARWVFAVKQTASGRIDRFKARYVARGFSQKPRIDFSDVVMESLGFHGNKIEPYMYLFKQHMGLNIGMGTGKLEISQPLLSKKLLDSYHRPIRDWFMTLPDIPIVTNEGQLIDQLVLGSLMYLSLGSRPAITYAVNLLARFSSNPGQKQWEGLDHLISYLCWHQHQLLIYDKKDQGLLLWTDGNWGASMREVHPGSW
ncbi:hypothetical protein O181_086672, partial [Austropuccinia psidii MF-1]|nr:hypothetical protein [Austropuccinia psidii MF-1]